MKSKKLLDFRFHEHALNLALPGCINDEVKAWLVPSPSSGRGASLPLLRIIVAPEPGMLWGRASGCGPRELGPPRHIVFLTPQPHPPAAPQEPWGPPGSPGGQRWGVVPRVAWAPLLRHGRRGCPELRSGRTGEPATARGGVAASTRRTVTPNPGGGGGSLRALEPR